jgi:WD40 repeat protein
VHVWNLEENEMEFKLKGENKRVLCVSISDKGELLAGADESSIILWNFNQKTECFQLSQPRVSILKFIRNDEILVGSSYDNNIYFWSLTYKGTLMFALDGHTKGVTSIFFSSDSKKLISGSNDETIKVWDLDEELESYNFKGHSDIVSSIDSNSEGTFLVSGSFDQSVIIWNLTTNQKEISLDYHFGAVFDVCFSPNSEFIASCSYDKVIKIYNFKRRELFLNINDVEDAPIRICFTPDGESIIAAYENKTIRAFSLPLGAETQRFTGASKKINRLKIPQQGEFLACSLQDGEILLLNLSDLSLYHSFKGEKSSSECLDFSSDLKFLTSGYLNGKIIFWNLRTLRLEFFFALKEDAVYSLIYSNNSRFLVSGHYSGLMVVWDVFAKTEEFRLKSHFSQVTSLVFIKNCKTLFSASKDNSIKKWQIMTCETSDLVKKQSEIIEKIMKTEVLKEEDELIKEKSNEISEKSFISLETNSIFHIYHIDFLWYFNALYQIQREDYKSLTIPAWCVKISNIQFTPLHFAAFKGVTTPLIHLIENSSPVKIRADEFGRSPVFYSIMAKHQSTTDLILNLLVLISEKCEFINWASSFTAIKNDLPLVIKNSSLNLPSFLASCFYFKDELPITGVAVVRAKFLPTINPDFRDFIRDSLSGEKENLKIKASLFEISASHGSKASIYLIRCILGSSNKEIFSTQFIKFLVISKWDDLIRLIYIYGAFLWVNLVLLCLLLAEVTPFWLFSTLYLNVNLIFLAWEFFRMKNDWSEYWVHFVSNFITIGKSFISILWVCLLMAGKSYQELSWLNVFLNMLRGMAGFRTFSPTRYYLQLLIQSIKSIRWFLLIYVYTTFSAGLLSVVIKDDLDFSFKTLWISPYGLTAGETDGMTSDSADFKYFTFCITVFVNIILMLNMIISILGDSFDEFQLNAMYYDFKERTNVIFEIEQILGIFNREERFDFLHICVNSDEADENSWRGKVLDIQVGIKDIGKKIIKKVDEVKRKISMNDERLARVESKNLAFEERIKEQNNLIDKRIGNVEEKVEKISQAIFKILNLMEKAK